MGSLGAGSLLFLPGFQVSAWGSFTEPDPCMDLAECVLHQWDVFRSEGAASISLHLPDFRFVLHTWSELQNSSMIKKQDQHRFC